MIFIDRCRLLSLKPWYFLTVGYGLPIVHDHSKVQSVLGRAVESEGFST